MRIVHKSKKMLRVEKRVGEPLEVYLRRRLNEVGVATLVAKELGISKASLSNWMWKFDIGIEKHFVSYSAPERAAVAAER